VFRMASVALSGHVKRGRKKEGGGCFLELKQ